ncbi:MAG: NAD(P)-dependent oxidoreductase, partial [Dehalococcoidia bacterium]
MKNALILAPFSGPQLQRLRRAVRVAHESWLETGRLYDPDELARRLRDERIHFLVVEGDFVFEEMMDEAADLELIGVCRNALNHVDVDAATQRGVLVVNAPGRNAVAVAEMTLGMMLALARRIPQADCYVKSGRWADPVSGYQTFRGTELAGKTAGIVGLGAIGRLVAQRLAAMGMRLLAHDPYLTPETTEGLGVTLQSLEDLLAQSDYVVVHAPANDETM